MTKFAYTIFCDQIRHETNKKLFYIGVYEGPMELLEPEVSLPTFTIAITLSTDIKDTFEEAEFVIEIPGQDPIRISADPVSIEHSDDKIAADEPAKLTAKLFLNLNNIKLIAGTKIITYVNVDGERIDSDTLHVTYNKPLPNKTSK